MLSVGERWCELRHRAVQFVDVLYLGGGYLGGGGHTALCASEMVAAAQVMYSCRNVEMSNEKQNEKQREALDGNSYVSTCSYSSWHSVISVVCYSFIVILGSYSSTLVHLNAGRS